MHAPIIALITDFGSGDYFTGVVKGVIKKHNPAAEIIDITHSVAPFSVLNAQFILAASYRHFPDGTIFFVVVDPGVGTERKPLIASDGIRFYVLPDNGILSAVESNRLRCFEINSSEYAVTSSTFHGRDIFAPVAARLSRGEKPETLGSLLPGFTEIPYPPYSKHLDGYRCSVQHVDNYGNVITTLPASEPLYAEGTSIRFEPDDRAISAMPCSCYAEISSDNAGILAGSAGFYELAANSAPLAELFGIRVGDSLRIGQHD